MFQVANGQQLWFAPILVDSFKSSKQKTCLSNIAKQLSCSMLSAAVFRSRSKSSNIVSKYIRVPSFHLLYNSNLLDWYLSSSTSALLPSSDLLTRCLTMTMRGQDEREKIDHMGKGLGVRRGDILLQRRPLHKWANHFPFGSKCSSGLRKSVCWGIQEGRPDSTGSLSAFQASFGLS